MKLWKILVVVAVLSQFMRGNTRVILTPFPDSIHQTAIDTQLFGFPLISLVIRSFQGCTTGIHLETRLFWIEWIYNFFFWITAVWIVSKVPESSA